MCLPAVSLIVGARWQNEGWEEDERADKFESTGRRLRSLKPNKELRGGSGPGGEAPAPVLLLHSPPWQPPGSSDLRDNLYRDLRHPRRTPQAPLDNRGVRRLRVRRLPRLRGRCPHRRRHKSVRTGGGRGPPGGNVFGVRKNRLQGFLSRGFL